MRVLVCLLLTGCCSTAPLQKVETAIAVSCVKTVPARPNLPVVPKAGIFEQAKALIVRDKMHQDYERELEAVIEGCK